MAEVLASLKKIGGSGEQYTETVLWTNPSPTADFAAQTITLSDSIGNYKYIGIKYCFNKTNTSIIDTAIYKTEEVRASIIDNSTDHNIIILGLENSNNYMYVRAVGYVSDTSIKFSIGYRTNATGTTGNACIPLEILGINELAHQTVGERYDLLPAKEFTGVAPTFATKGRAKAVWIAFKRTGTNEMTIVTNVNPTTGEVEENGFYRSRQGSSVIDQPTGNSIIITDTSVALQNQVSSAATTYILSYTY